MDYSFDLGGHGWPVDTKNVAAQAWFDRGLMWTYAFNHDEAIACFERAVRADRNCALAHWGIAYCTAPSYNFEWELFAPKRRETALVKGRKALDAAEMAARTPLEAALAGALRKRYPEDPATEDFGPYNNAFADAMRALHAGSPEILDLKALFVEAMMLRTPWKLWDTARGVPAEGADTIEVIDTLEAAFHGLDGARRHPGLLHLYIHALEMSPTPEKALWAGDALARLAPDAGHLVHMGSHIDVLCGDYARVVERNLAAHRVNDRFARQVRGTGDFIIYRLHDLHFLAYGAMFLGQESVALNATAEMRKILNRKLISKVGKHFETAFSLDIHVAIRFGRWERLATRKLPKEPDLYPATTAFTRYGRALALAALGRVDEALGEQSAFRAAAAAVPEKWYFMNGTARDVLAVAEAMLEGEIAYRRGNFDHAFAELTRAVALDDALPYAEPWSWMQPTRHALGALLLEQKRHEEAEAVFRADLGLDRSLPRPCWHPDNMWALSGLRDCLLARGADEEARIIGDRLRVAAARSEVSVEHACLCAGRQLQAEKPSRACGTCQD